jgi:F-type H+-transporting ATPase subunit delta
MTNTTHHSATAMAYAKSLLEVANEQGNAAAVAEELNAVAGIIAEDPTLALFLSDPAISAADRLGVVERAFAAGQVSSLTFHFLKLLAQRGALGRIQEIAAAYDDLVDEQLGKVEVDVTVAQPLTPDELETVRQRISAAIGRDAVLHPYVDDSIIGGLVIRVGDKLIDGSVKAQLDLLRRQLLAARPRP